MGDFLGSMESFAELVPEEWSRCVGVGSSRTRLRRAVWQCFNLRNYPSANSMRCHHPVPAGSMRSCSIHATDGSRSLGAG